MSFMIVAILAGICPDLWRWHWRPPPFPFPIPPDPIIPPDPVIPPDPIKPPPDEPWPIIGGIVGGVGGAIAWIALGADYAQPGSLVAPLVLGLLGGTAALWLLDCVASLVKRGRAT